MSYNTCHATCDTSHTTCGTSHATCDMRQGTNGWRCSSLRTSKCATRSPPIHQDVYIAFYSVFCQWDDMQGVSLCSKLRPENSAFKATSSPNAHYSIVHLKAHNWTALPCTTQCIDALNTVHCMHAITTYNVKCKCTWESLGSQHNLSWQHSAILYIAEVTSPKCSNQGLIAKILCHVFLAKKRENKEKCSFLYSVQEAKKNH